VLFIFRVTPSVHNRVQNSHEISLFWKKKKLC